MGILGLHLQRKEEYQPKRLPVRLRVTQHLHDHTFGSLRSCLTIWRRRGSPIARSLSVSPPAHLFESAAPTFHRHCRGCRQAIWDRPAYTRVSAHRIGTQAYSNPHAIVLRLGARIQVLGVWLEYKVCRYPGCRIDQHHNSELTSRSNYHLKDTSPGSISAIFALRGFHSLAARSFLVHREGLLPTVLHPPSTDSTGGHISAS